MSTRILYRLVNAIRKPPKPRFHLLCCACNTSSCKLTMALPEFPKTLKEFGYDFDREGKLRKIDSRSGEITEKGFEFNVSEDPDYNQRHYEALGEVINNYVYELLEKEGLKRLPVPKDSSNPLELRSFVFATEDAFVSEKLLVLIHGSGVVKAGQWARRLIINDNLETGTQIPYIKRAKELGYGVIVLNTNDNQRIQDGKLKPIEGSQEPQKHVETVWKDYIKPSEAKHIAIVAHSYGGVCVLKFARSHPQEFKDRIFAVGLTDSVHAMPSEGCEHLVKVARNWVSSNKPLDTPEVTVSGDIQSLSAGHPVHEMTSSSCIESLFRFLEERHKTVVSKEEL